MSPTVLEPQRPATLEASDSANGIAAGHLDRCIARYVERCRKNIPAFVERHFTLAQAWRLQRQTLWLDLACAPVNSALALPYLVFHKAADTVERVGFSGLAPWAKRVPPGIKTGYQREIERLICIELLEWDREQAPASLPQGFLEELESVPSLRDVSRSLASAESGRACARTLADLLRQFSSARALVSDLCASVLALGTSWWLMGTTSASLSGIAHGMARRSAHDRAASRFFLGRKAGRAFYSVFPPKVEERTVWTILVVLAVGLTLGAMVGSPGTELEFAL